MLIKKIANFEILHAINLSIFAKFKLITAYENLRTLFLINEQFAKSSVHY